MIAIPLKNGYTLFYCGSNCFFEDHEEINKMLKDNDEAIPSDWGLFGGHDDDFEHLAELDNEGNKIEFE